MQNGGMLAKIYSIAVVAKDLISVILPALELLLKKDLNKDGVIGERK